MAEIYERGCQHVLHAGCGITWAVELWTIESGRRPHRRTRLLFLPAPTEFDPGRDFGGPVALGFGMSGHVASKLYDE
jgi:hypothetical protein